MIEREGTKQHAIDDAEDGGRAADPQRERHDNGGGKAGRASDRAHRCPQIAREVGEKVPGSFAGDRLPRQIETSGTDPRNAFGGVRRQAAIDLPHPLVLVVVAQFLVELAFDGRRPYQFTNAVAETSEKRHMPNRVRRPEL